MNAEPAPPMRCSTCDDELDGCWFCDEPDCPNPACYGCTSVATGQIVPQPHAHGG